MQRDYSVTCDVAIVMEDGTERPFDPELLDTPTRWQESALEFDAVHHRESRKTPICPEMDTEIQVGPTGKRLLPLAVL